MTIKIQEPVPLYRDIDNSVNNCTSAANKGKEDENLRQVHINNLDNAKEIVQSDVSSKSNTITNGASISSPVSCNNFEDVLDALGGFGPYQFFVLVLLLILEIPTAFVTFLPIFVGETPKSWVCDNSTVVMSLNEICSCNGSRVPYSMPFNNSIVAEWGLICEKEWVADFISSVQMAGMFFGSVFGSQFADWHGRRLGFLAGVLLLCSGSILSALALNPYMYAIARFFCGVGVTSFMNVTLVGLVEVMPTKWRSLSNCIGPTGEGIMILSCLAYFTRPWKTLYWVTIAPFFLVLVIYPFVPESPRWLMKKNRVEDAHKVLKYMAKMNRKQDIGLDTIKKIVEKEQLLENEQEAGHRWTYLDFVRDKNLRVISIYNMAIWFAWSLTYYGISFNIKNLEGNIYLNVFYMGLVNALGQRGALLINNRLGRRKALFVSMSFCAFFLVALAIALMITESSKMPGLVVSLCLLGQFGMASSRSAARLLSGESFPTAVRTMGMGVGGITANIAGILTPQIAYLGSRWPSVPFFIFAIVSVGGSLISFLMNETMGQPLDSKEDVHVDQSKRYPSFQSAFLEIKNNDNSNIKSRPSSAFWLNSSKRNSDTEANKTNLRSSIVLVSIAKLAEESHS